MKLIIAGSRTIRIDKDQIKAILQLHDAYYGAEEIVSGGALGVDTAGEKYAEHWSIYLKRFPADWQTHGRKAGHIRNAEMADYADALLLIWDGKSPGSKNMLAEMKKRKKPIYEVIIRKHNVKY